MWLVTDIRASCPYSKATSLAGAGAVAVARGSLWVWKAYTQGVCKGKIGDREKPKHGARSVHYVPVNVRRAPRYLCTVSPSTFTLDSIQA